MASTQPAAPQTTSAGRETPEPLARRLRRELDQFNDLWKGGYFEGDPLDPLSKSSYGPFGFMSVLHATYLRCIVPYVGPHSRVLEIGPGRGAWTRTFVSLGAREVWCLDALSREHNGFDAYVGDVSRVTYIEVADFRCADVPDDHFDFFFSFGCFCHISFAGTTEYMRNIYRKLRPGANGFLLVADYDRYNAAIADRSLHLARVVHASRSGLIARLWNRVADWFIARKYGEREFRPRNKHEPDTPHPGRFYHAGLDETCAMMREIGYEILSEDVGTVYRDPIIHFRKPTRGTNAPSALA